MKSLGIFGLFCEGFEFLWLFGEEFFDSFEFLYVFSL
jgi:hypothetical protein